MIPYTFARASADDLKTLIRWMDNNYDAIGSNIREDIETWVKGDPIYNPVDLSDLLMHFEWHIEAGHG